LDEELDMMAARLLMMALLGLAATGCDGGDKGKTPAPQADAPQAEPAINSIDRRFAGQPAPEVSLETAPGQTTTLAALLAAHPDKRVLVNLWATWCPPCLAEMPELDALAAEEAATLHIIPVSQDMEGWQAVDKFFAPGKFKTLKPVLDQPGSLGERLKAKGLPISVLYDAKGREVWRVAGVPDWTSADIRAQIKG
jgi:thiol-disulfide isomerase/thioredoxin